MDEQIKRRNGWIIFIMFTAITVAVAAGIGYAYYEIMELAASLGLENRMVQYQNAAISYAVFMLLLIYLAIEIGTRLTSQGLLGEAFRLEDELQLMRSQYDDLSVMNKGLENRLRIKNGEAEKEKRHYGNAELLETRTGLHNEAHLLGVLPNEINRARRDKKPLVITLVAINELAAFEAKEGVAAADELVRSVALVIKRCAKRAGDLSFYLEEGSFVILFSGLSVENTRRFLSFIRENIFGESTDTALERLGVTIAATIAFAEAMPEAESFLEQARSLLIRSQSDGEAVIFEVIE